MSDNDPQTPRHSGTAPPADPWFAETLRRIGAGTQVFGRFRLQRELGTGGMAVVWLAEDEQLKDAVALKFLSPQLAEDLEAVEDLMKEITRGRRLTHHGVVRLHDMHQDADAHQIAISMEYVDGRTLGHEKARQPDRCFDVAGRLFGWTNSLCETLTYVHERGRIVHRDLKPRNVLLANTGELKIADFGISATLSSTESRLTQHLSTSGTPAYMSPQQAAGRPATVSDDVYGLGATLYELVTSKPPFHSTSPTVILHQVKTETAPSMKERRAEFGIAGRAPIPEAWEETIAACLAKEPAQRPRSIADVQQALRVGLGAIQLGPLPLEPAEAEPDAPTVRATEKAPPADSSVAEPKFSAPKAVDPLAKPEAPARSWLRKFAPVAGVLILCLAVGLTAWQMAKHSLTDANATAGALADKHAAEELKTKTLEHARTILGRDTLNELQALRAVELCEDVAAVDPDFRDVRQLQHKADAILAALSFETSPLATVETKRARWSAIDKLPPLGKFPVVQAHLAATSATPEAASTEKKSADLRGKIERARAALANRLSDGEYRISVAREEAQTLAVEAGALHDQTAGEQVQALNRALDEEQARVEAQFAAASPHLDQLLARFQNDMSQPTPNWEQVNLLKGQIEQSLKGLDSHQDDPKYSTLFSRMAKVYREQMDKLNAAASRPKPSTPMATPLAKASTSENGAQSYKGTAGPYPVVFDLTFSPDGNVVGRYTIWGRNITRLRLDGRLTGNELALDEYTPDTSAPGHERLTAHLKLTMAKTSAEIRWSGTMQNVGSDTSKYPLSLSRRR